MLAKWPFFHNILRWLFRSITPLISDKTFLGIRYLYWMRSIPNFADPKTLNEKIIWRMLYDRNPVFQTLSDKVQVREYVIDKGLKSILTTQYMVSSNPNTIVFEDLPQPFIIKPSHASGLVRHVRGQTGNWEELRQCCHNWLKIDFSQINREWQYAGLEPKIIVEEWLGEGTRTPLELKIHCFHGQPKLISAHLDNFSSDPINRKFDIEWRRIDLDITRKRSINIPKPKRLNEILRIARKLSSDFDYVRVDLFHLPGRIAFGELTFTPAGGTSTKIRKLQIELGKEWHLPTT